MGRITCQENRSWGDEGELLDAVGQGQGLVPSGRGPNLGVGGKGMRLQVWGIPYDLLLFSQKKQHSSQLRVRKEVS